MHLLGRFSRCFLDGRNPALVEHRIEEMLAQRVYGLALGYEDLKDHEQLRHDPLLQVLAGKAEPGKEALAGKSTLNRMELGNGAPDRYKKITFWRDAIDDLLVEVFLEAHSAAPEQIVLDIDTTALRYTASKRGGSITAITITTVICRCMCLLRLGLQATHLAHAQVGTIRVRLLKMGAQIRVTVRKIWVQMSSSFPLQTLFRQALQQLRC